MLLGTGVHERWKPQSQSLEAGSTSSLSLHLAERQARISLCSPFVRHASSSNSDEGSSVQASSLTPLYSDHDAVQWGQQIAEGLAYLHSANPVVGHSVLLYNTMSTYD